MSESIIRHRYYVVMMGWLVLEIDLLMFVLYGSWFMFTCKQAGPEMRTIAIAARPGAVERAYIVGDTRVGEASPSL